MKKEIHPTNYRPVVFKDMSNEDIFISRSTINAKEIQIYEALLGTKTIIDDICLHNVELVKNETYFNQEVMSIVIQQFIDSQKMDLDFNTTKNINNLIVREYKQQYTWRKHMGIVKVSLKGDVKEFEKGTSVADIAKSIGMGLYKAACACEIDGKLCDLRTAVENDCSVSILTFDDEGGKHAFWHSGSHVLAEAVKHLFPDTKFTIGPAIENGFYYDLDCETVLTPEILEKIEEEIHNIIKKDEPITRYVLSREDALKKMKGNEYKEELINELPADAEISFYEQGDFTDLCAGPHLMSTGALGT